MKHEKIRPVRGARPPRGPVTTVTSKGQVTIPKRFREHLGLKAGSRVEFDVGPGGDVVVRKASKTGGAKPSRFARLRGTATAGMTTDEIMALTRGDDWKESS
jgi:antitoxin PrlF